MVKKSSRKVTVEQIIDLLDMLPAELEPELVEQMQKWFLKRGLQEIAGIDFTGKTYKKWRQLIEQLDYEKFDTEIFMGAAETFEQFVKRIEELNAQIDTKNKLLLISQNPSDEKSNEILDDPLMMLEQAYQDLQSHLIQVRQAVAQAIATEKQLESQVKKNEEQVDVWQSRVDMAKQQKNEDLAIQAEARQKQYVIAVAELSEQLIQQRSVTKEFRQRLSELETEATKTYAKKQTLIARSRLAESSITANDLLEKIAGSDVQSIFEQVEQKIKEREAVASSYPKLYTSDQPLNYEDVLQQSIRAMDNSTEIIQRMEQLILQKEAANELTETTIAVENKNENE